nr:hypothetical protein [Tanacetum cinerariifolium]
EGCRQRDIQFSNLEELQENQEEHICYAGYTKSSLFPDTFGNLGVDESETSGPETHAKEVVDNGNGSALIFLGGYDTGSKVVTGLPEEFQEGDMVDALSRVLEQTSSKIFFYISAYFNIECLVVVVTHIVHGLLFPTIAPEYIHLRYFLRRPLDNLFFLTLMEVLNSSSGFNIHIQERSPAVPLNIDVDDLRRREMMERQPTDIKDIELKNPYNRKWETLTSSSTSVLDALTDSDQVECKLNWFSQ